MNFKRRLCAASVGNGSVGISRTCRSPSRTFFSRRNSFSSVAARTGSSIDWKSTLAHPSATASKKGREPAHSDGRSAVGFCPLEAMFSLRFLALSKIGYQVVGWCNAIDTIDKSDLPALRCPSCVRVMP
jgi:hypothetical protein